MYSYLCLCILIVMFVLYSVSLCCLVYCLCVNVYIQLPPGLNPTAVNKIYKFYLFQNILIGFRDCPAPTSSSGKSFQVEKQDHFLAQH